MPERLDYLADGSLDYWMAWPPVLLKQPVLAALEREMSKDLHQLEYQYWLDAICYPRLDLHYRKILAFLDCPVVPDALTSESRQRFFLHGGEVKKGDGVWLRVSGLQRLLGWQDHEPGDQADPDNAPATTGQAHLDALVELHLAGMPVEWMASHVGVSDVFQMARYFWERKTGNTQQSRTSDKNRWAKLKEDATFSSQLESARAQALDTLLLRTGPQASELNSFKVATNDPAGNDQGAGLQADG